MLLLLLPLLVLQQQAFDLVVLSLDFVFCRPVECSNVPFQYSIFGLQALDLFLEGCHLLSHGGRFECGSMARRPLLLVVVAVVMDGSSRALGSSCCGDGFGSFEGDEIQIAVEVVFGGRHAAK